MNDKNAGNLAPGLTIDDIIYLIFRHKWKIAVISGAGILAAALLHWLTPHEYQSEAKLFVKYVVETKSPGQVGAANNRIISDDGANAISTEVEILTSLDLAQQVADTIGAEQILGAGGGSNQYDAALFIRKNLLPDISKGGKVIHVIFKHPNANTAQNVLRQVIDAYLKKHEEIHQHVGAFDEFLRQQTDQLRSQLRTTEDELRRAKTNAGILSMDDSKKAYTEQIAKIQQEIRDAEADLAERQAAAAEMAKLLHTQAPSLTNDSATAAAPPPAPEKIAEYKRLCRLLDSLTKRQQDLLVQFTPENSWVKQLDEQIAANEKLKDQLESENPALVAEGFGTKGAAADPSSGMRAALLTETARAAALQSKMRVLTGQLGALRKEAGSIDEAEGPITELQRQKKLQEANYEYFAANLEQSKIDQALGAGRAYNISVIQKPSQGARVSNSPKLTAAVAVGPLVAAFALAFLLEFYLDKSIKRPIEVETKLGLPLFISIPRFASNQKNRALQARKAAHLLPETSSPTKRTTPETNGSDAKSDSNGHGTKVSPESSDGELAPWDPRYILRPFCEALRDGLITFFEVNNLTHKPKLVAVTSCTEGAGVSTIAASLAASLSETGEGNVLLVNMNQTDGGGVHEFHKGDLSCGLDEVLEAGTRDKALVQDNLYVASEAANGDKLPIVFPNRFKSLVPRLRASDYDYIIFDMPAVSQITSTQRLARFMDMVLMVVEAEKTDSEVAKRASSLLRQSKTNVGIILNKRRTYLPKRLRREV